jgi:hypothetical protein
MKLLEQLQSMEQLNDSEREIISTLEDRYHIKLEEDYLDIVQPVIRSHYLRGFQAAYEYIAFKRYVNKNKSLTNEEKRIVLSPDLPSMVVLAPEELDDLLDRCRRLAAQSVDCDIDSLEFLADHDGSLLVLAEDDEKAEMIKDAYLKILKREIGRENVTSRGVDLYRYSW